MPFNGDPASETPGYAVEMARKIFAPHGIAIDYANMPWGDALKAAAEGEIEGVIGANRTEAAKLVVPDESIGAPRMALYVKRGQSWKYQNIASLGKVRVGVIADYKYWDAIDEYIAKHEEPKVYKLSGDAPLKDGLNKLLAGELDVVPEAVPVFGWAVKDAGLNPADFQAAYLHESEPVFIAFTPKDERGARYAKILTEGIRALRRSGELEKLLARYGQRDWAKD